VSPHAIQKNLFFSTLQLDVLHLAEAVEMHFPSEARMVAFQPSKPQFFMAKTIIKWEKIPSGKRLHNYEKSQFLMGKSTINGHFQKLFVCLPEGT